MVGVVEEFDVPIWEDGAVGALPPAPVATGWTIDPTVILEVVVACNAWLLHVNATAVTPFGPLNQQLSDLK